MSHYVVTNSLGLITGIFTGSYNEVLQTCHLLKLGYDPVEVPRPPSENEYIKDGELIARPRIEGLTVEGRIIHGLPEDSSVTVDGLTHSDVAGSVELEFNTPGPHTVEIKSGVYIPEVVILP